MFRWGTKEDIEVLEQQMNFDWKRDLVEKELLGHLSKNPQRNELIHWLIIERKVIDDPKWRDEQGKGLLEWTCAQDADVKLVKFFMDKWGLTIEKDREGNTCLDIACR